MLQLPSSVTWLVIILLGLCGQCFGNVLSQPSRLGDQYIQEKQDQKSEQLVDEQDPYHLTNEFKIDQQPYPEWNPYRQGNFNRPNRFINLFGYPNPIFLPVPVVLQPDFLYPYPLNDEYEDPISRANVRRPSPYRNSPIYYVRIPPTPYMFVPGLGYTSQPPTFAPNFSPLMHFNSLPSLPIPQSISPVINLPLNILSNGKPTNIYQLDSNEIQPQYQPFAPPRPYRPPFQPYVQDSKITHLKRPFIFNGKPEEIYLLPNNINPMQSVYQSPLPNYY